MPADRDCFRTSMPRNDNKNRLAAMTAGRDMPEATCQKLVNTLQKPGAVVDIIFHRRKQHIPLARQGLARLDFVP